MKEEPKKDVWISGETDPDEMIKDERHEEASAYAEDNISLLIDLWLAKDYESLDKGISYGNFIMSYFESGLKPGSKEKAMFELGKLYGTIQLSSSLLSDLGFDRRTMEQYKSDLLTIKYLKQIIMLMKERGGMTCEELAEHLGEEAGVVQEKMIKMKQLGIISMIVSGQLRTYSLTDNGSRLGRLIDRTF